jgi:hypothetical protein
MRKLVIVLSVVFQLMMIEKIHAQQARSQVTKYSLTASQAAKDLPRLRGQKHKVLILGSRHFDLGSNASDWKPEKEVDMSTPQRQQEMLQVVEALKKFRPTRICIEWLPSNDSTFLKIYQRYLAGNWNLKIGEYYQIGFRLAKAMGHEKLYCIDNRPKQPESLLAIEDFDKYVAEEGSISTRERRTYDSLNEKFNRYIDSVAYNMSLPNIFRFVNSDEVKRETKRIWLTGLVHAGNKTSYAGADLTGNWYQRNIRIFSNVKKLCAEKEERILIVYGYGHAFILEEMFRGSQEFDVVPVNSVLK